MYEFPGIAWYHFLSMAASARENFIRPVVSRIPFGGLLLRQLRSVWIPGEFVEETHINNNCCGYTKMKCNRNMNLNISIKLIFTVIFVLIFILILILILI